MIFIQTEKAEKSSIRELVQFYLYLIVTLALTTFILLAVFAAVVLIPKNKFYKGYNSLIQDKYRILSETNESKIIICSGSSSAFGLNQVLLEEETGYKVANLGLHASFGQSFVTELSKENINPGDIVLLGFEYNWMGWADDEDKSQKKIRRIFDVDPELIMTGIDSDIKMYLRVPYWMWDDLIGELFSFFDLKKKYQGASGIYSRESFDEKTGQMILPRPESVSQMYEKNKNAFNNLVVDGISHIDDTSIEYLIKYKDYVEKHGASVYFTTPPIYEGCVDFSYDEFDRLMNEASERTGITCISRQSDYIFPGELMYNATYHCNSEGEKVRTELLVKDLKNAGIIN